MATTLHPIKTTMTTTSLRVILEDFSNLQRQHRRHHVIFYTTTVKQAIMPHNILSHNNPIITTSPRRRNSTIRTTMHRPHGHRYIDATRTHPSLPISVLIHTIILLWRLSPVVRQDLSRSREIVVLVASCHPTATATMGAVASTYYHNHLIIMTPPPNPSLPNGMEL